MSNSDDNSLQGRVRRYAQVGGAVGGLAARAAAARWLGIELDRGQHAGDLAAALGGIKGPLMKVAQILSSIPDALPEEYIAELGQLQADAPSMGWPFVKRRMASELGPDWRQRFDGFERQAARAASLGQVHRAEAGGRALACKLQYPDMRSAVEADLRQLKIAFALFQRADKTIDTREIHAEIAARLREELDYHREARHLALYAYMLRDEDGVHVPEVEAALSTDRLLTMSWLDGAPLLERASDASQAARNRIARNMFRAWYVPFYTTGVIHGDPHLGNYTIRAEASVNLLDFGCIRIFPPSFVTGVIDLYRALETGDAALAVHAYETWGFVEPSRELIEVMNIWAEFVYAPLLENKPRPIQESSSGLYGAKVAHKVHTELRRIGGITPPREFVLMDRAAVGLGSVFLHLKAKINWHRLFHDLIADYDEATLRRTQARAVKKFDLTPAG